MSVLLTQEDFLQISFTIVVFFVFLVPAINDVTYPELLFLLHEVAGLEPRLKQALDTGMLICVDNGQSSPCLDLRQTSHRLVQIVNQEKVMSVTIISRNNILKGKLVDSNHQTDTKNPYDRKYDGNF